MSVGEVETFTARVLLLMRRGMRARQAEALADTLRRRDRECDDRRACLECQRLSDTQSCTAWRRAGIGSAKPPGDLLPLLQRCPAFAPAITTTGESHDGF